MTQLQSFFLGGGQRILRSQIHSPWLRDIVDSGIGLSYQADYLAWRSVTTTLWQIWLYPPSQRLWIWLQISNWYSVCAMIQLRLRNLMWCLHRKRGWAQIGLRIAVTMYLFEETLWFSLFWTLLFSSGDNAQRGTSKLARTTPANCCKVRQVYSRSLAGETVLQHNGGFCNSCITKRFPCIRKTIFLREGQNVSKFLLSSLIK